MGRPLHKRFMGDKSGSIQVTSYFRAGAGSEVAGQDDTYIVRQRSSNKFLIADTSGGWQEVMTLVDKAQGSLSAGEFMINAQASDGAARRITRFYNRTIRMNGGVKEKWDITAATELAITGITQANPGVVTVSSTSALATGDTIIIRGVGGMVEVNDLGYTITVLSGTTFSLNNTNTTTFGLYTSGGTVFKSGGIAAGATPDIQVV